jgi:hypothetical protein
MVKAIFEIPEAQNRVLNILKSKEGLKNRNDALILALNIVAENLEPELNPEFITKADQIMKEPTLKVRDFEKKYGL